MKITVERTSAREIEIQPPQNPPPPPDLPHKFSFPPKPPRRRKKTPGAGVRLKRESGAPSAKRGSRPETPLLRWKFDEGNGKNNPVEEDKSSGEAGRKSGRRIRSVVSARKLAAGLWRLSLPEIQTNVGQRVGLQSGVDHFGATIHCHHVDRVHRSPAKDLLLHSPKSVSGPKHGLLYKSIGKDSQNPYQSISISQLCNGGGNKMGPRRLENIERNEPNIRQQNLSSIEQVPLTVISALEAELEQARARINELETERRSSKKKIEQFLRKLSEERAAWRSREHEKVRAIIDDMKSDLSREKKNRQRLEIVNSKLVNELSDAKVSAKRYLQEYEKERKARELIEELREEVEDERKMLQMAEVWREERVQMKLVDAKVMLEDKYAQMKILIEGLESFLNSRSSFSDSEEIKKAEFLKQIAASVNIQDIRDLS
ncbi:hypothetical protein DH2020_033327 [Rehmannia glutinosa]|uniref:Uncharacterized protein n=1 Tax=Rehmannia glutinosa TaxID=99300 RepID=A0ABR0VD00_REHGL